MTLISVGCVALLAGLAQPPAAEPAVREVTVQTPYGSKTYFYLPADASPQMRAAYKAREFAERGVVIVEHAQELQVATLWTDRRAEAYRSNAMQSRFSFGAGVLPFPSGTAPLLYQSAPAAGSVGNPFNPGGFVFPGLGSGGWGNGFAAAEVTDPAQRALDRAVEAELKANDQLRRYLDGKRKPDGAPATIPVKKAPSTDAESKGGDLLDAAVRQEQAARQREQEAFDRYQRAEASDRQEAKKVWERASKECDDARALLKAAREQAAERSK